MLFWVILSLSPLLLDPLIPKYCTRGIFSLVIRLRSKTVPEEEERLLTWLALVCWHRVSLRASTVAPAVHC